MKTEALAISELTISAQTAEGRFNVVQDVSLRLERGAVTGVAGESGSGKTVTALAAMRLLEPRILKVETGSIRLGETDLLTVPARELKGILGKRISMIFQEPMTSLDPMMAIGPSVAEVIRAHDEVSKKTARKRAVDLLGRVGIPNPAERYNHYPFQMSGGMLQRVLIAMAISCEPDVLIADEPTTALDVTVQAQILNLLRQLSRDGMAVMLVTHDMGVISEYTDNLVVMYAGQVVETGETRKVLHAPNHPYTAGLIASVPSTRHRKDRLSSIPGRVPLLHEIQEGCRFRPRCMHAQSVCETPISLLDLAPRRETRCVRHSEIELEGVE